MSQSGQVKNGAMSDLGRFFIMKKTAENIKLSVINGFDQVNYVHMALHTWVSKTI